MNWLSEILRLIWILSLMSPSELIAVLGIGGLRNNKTESQPKAMLVQFLLSSLFPQRNPCSLGKITYHYLSAEVATSVLWWTGGIFELISLNLWENRFLIQREGGWDERNNWPPIFSWIFDNDALFLGQWLAQKFCVYWLGRCWQFHGRYSGQELEDTTNNSPG